MKYYKFLTADNKGQYSEFDFTEYLPRDGKPGAWLTNKKTLKLCHSGYHAFELKDILAWASSDLYEVELSGNILRGDDKVVAQFIRFVRKIESWNEKSARLFACWCAERALLLFEKERPNDKRPRNVIDIARRFAEENATSQELSAAAARAAAVAGDAAWAAAAARVAAGDAARDAERNVQTAYLLEMLGIEEAK